MRRDSCEGREACGSVVGKAAGEGEGEGWRIGLRGVEL